MPTYRVFDTESIITTEDLLNEFLVNMVSTAPGITDISVGSKLWAIGYTLARQQSSIYYTLHFYRKQSFVLTATGKYLDLHGIEAGISRKVASEATGTVTFFRNSPAPIDILIPAGTIVTTPIVSNSALPLKFMTTQDRIIITNASQIDVPIRCLSTGVVGNLPAGSISRIESVLPGAQSVTSDVTSGGQEIEDDDSYRERILTAWAARETGTTAAIRNAVLTVSGIRNVMIVDPARNRVGQYFVTTADTTRKDQIRLETQSPLESKYDINIQISGTSDTGLTMTLQRVDEKGSIISQEIIPNITSGWDLLDKVNSWQQGGIIYINELFLDDNPYDDPVKQSTNNEVVLVTSISPATQFERISLMIESVPVIDPSPDSSDTIGTAKRLVVSTQTQYYHNQILGQTEVSPLVEIHENIGTYGNMVRLVNEKSGLIKMTLLDEKTAVQTKNPEPYVAGENIIRVDFTPVLEVVSPTHEDICIIDATEGIIGVGQISSPFEITYKYRAKTVDASGNQIEFGDKIPEELIMTLTPSGSELVFASPVLTPDIVTNTQLNFCDELPESFSLTKMKSVYVLIRGKVDVTVVPYDLTDEPNAELMASVVAAIEKVRPAGVEVNVIYPETRLVDVTVAVEVIASEGYEPSQFYDIIRTNITDYLRGLQMGETAYRDKMIAAANPSVKGLKVAHISSPAADVTIPDTAFLRPGTIQFSMSSQ